MESSKIITKPQPATLSDLDGLAQSQFAVCARLLNIATGLAVVVEELREQVNGLLIQDAGTPDATIEVLPLSEHLDNLKRELGAMRAMFNPSRQQRRAAERAAEKG